MSEFRIPSVNSYAPLVELFGEAQRSAGPWTADTAAALAGQQENVSAFRESQLHVILDS